METGNDEKAARAATNSASVLLEIDSREIGANHAGVVSAARERQRARFLFWEHLQ